MRFWRNEKRAINKISNNRINLIMAIIFLLALAILIKLFKIQIYNYDLYSTQASSQQLVSNQLEPSRGRIFIQDSPTNTANELYPLATNKNFALVYAVPKAISNPEKIAKQLYFIFKQQKIEKDVEDLFKKQDEERLNNELLAINKLSPNDLEAEQAKIIKKYNESLLDKKSVEIRRIRKEAEINLRKQAAIDNYMKILTKPGDPYEPLEEKVDEQVLKNLYLSLNDLNKQIKIEDLEIKDNSIWTNNNSKQEELKISGIGFVTKAYRFYPENNIGANMIGFVGYVGDEQKGRYGLEEYFNEELAGKYGSIKAERDAKGEMIIINNQQYNKPQDGSDLILTINRSIQYAACTKLNEAVLKHGADGGSVIIIEPKTGAILAMCTAPDYDPNNFQEIKDMGLFNNQAVFSQYEPGSIFKIITMAIGLDQNKVTPETTYFDSGSVKIANYNIENSDRQAHGLATMEDVLEKSLNTGAIFVMEQSGPVIFSDYVKSFGFGEKTGIELEGESKGDIINLLKEKNKEIYAATASFGQGIAVTPLQMVVAFAGIANGGILMKPYVVKEIIKSDNSKMVTEPRQIKRVISEKSATILAGMMVNVVEKGHGKRAGVKGYYVAGKTGTAQVPRKNKKGYEEGVNIGSFAGFAPVDDPRFVMLVRIDHPRDVDWAESSAAPLFGEITEFMLNYWQVPKER